VTLAPALLLVVFRSEGIAWRVDLAWEPVLLAMQAAGLIGFALALLQIDLMRFAGLKQAVAFARGDPLPLPDEALQTRGVYRLVRHPLYLFSLLLLWPVTTMTWAYLGFCVGATLYLGIGSLLEERRMLEAYGEVYEAYRRRVPWLIPFVPRVRMGN
jgi:protein-S-isoprenylcysteine O-methyltransferase Ste14